MTPAQLAKLHAACFSYAPRPWSATEFASLLQSQQSRLLQDDGGFALFRLAGPEAELLTIAVHHDKRRQRIAAGLLEQGRNLCKSVGVEEVFLEVSEVNSGAIELYKKTGFREVARRTGYYIGPNGQKITAIVMALTL